MVNDKLLICPAEFEMLRVAGQRAPDVGHAVDFFRRLDVGEDALHDGMIAGFLDKFDGRHRHHSLQERFQRPRQHSRNMTGRQPKAGVISAAKITTGWPIGPVYCWRFLLFLLLI